MLSFTTDVRMEKLQEINSRSGHAVEAVFWLRDMATQWRVKGLAFGIGAAREEEGEQTARAEIKKAMRVKAGSEEGSQSTWSWEREVTTYFANHTPVMRGSFKNPPPGRPRSEIPSDPALKLGQKVEDLHDPVARKNFRVVVIRPVEVDRLDLADYEQPRRWKWRLTNADSVYDGDESGDWEEVELWP
ncbi:hypothetical protein ASPZODRAFT_126786 [Penicilliopsis zonata CBS 506.65]|uniref:Pyridoxamine 5'-phosphate oxidase Alr4036 family FMN-binding domain-containing protein n=1 Tax=Penicilliopsis zonata CBS 506.65 TaxID=1073090 RepID=A0A1L9SUL9_9EURO|nr:hypothetical protein ASPZODRAFT_126786 [Penicilliopsis zonata CBS 506.65]OJJ50836.1 hypothetical protein ASPZODRAFT_126786 [Penicilliopsis zonata CBS 506.65]